CPNGRRVRISGAGRALPTRASSALLPTSWVAAGCRGHRAGDVARGLAGPERLRGASLAPHLALQDRDQPLPERAPRPEAAPGGGIFYGRATQAHTVSRADVARPLPRRSARRGGG